MDGISNRLEGYGTEEQWVTSKDILDPMLIQAFHHRYSEQSALRPRGHPRRTSSATRVSMLGGSFT